MISLPQIANIMQVATGASLLLLTLLVYTHQRKNDKEVLRSRAWETQQQINYLAVEHPHALRASEILTSGKILPTTTRDDLKVAMYICFIQINRVHYLWRGWKSGLIGKRELLDEVRPTIRLLIGHQELFQYCLTRGYSKNFVAFMLKEQVEVEGSIGAPNDPDAWADELLTRLAVVDSAR